MRPPASAPDLVVVVRTAGERTAAICRALLLRQLPAGHLHLVDERPLEAALRRCYQIGIDSGAEWMMTVDADVLGRAGAVPDLLRRAIRMPQRYVQVEGRIRDKLRGGYREAGHRVYRTRYLSRALAALPRDGAEIRPEFATLERLSRQGYPSLKCGIRFGIHDYEQYYRDLYRKAFVHGQKHPHWTLEVLPRWKAQADHDPDFAIAMRGYCDGLQSATPARIDARRYADDAARAMHQLGLAEKAPLDDDPETLAAIEALQAVVLATAPDDEPAPAGARLRALYRRFGVARAGLAVFGSWLNRLGDRARRAAEPE